AAASADGEGERLPPRVPVGALVDARLALDPACVCRVDVVLRGLEDVEDEPAARTKERARRAQRLEPLGVGSEVQVRAKRTRDEIHALVDRRAPEVAEPQVEEVADAGLPRLVGA